MKGSFSAARDGKAIITRNPASFRFIEDGRYRILFGSSRVPRDGEEVSGDSYTFKSGLPGQAILSLSDGMGSGQAASEDSEKVMELTEQLLGTGFSARSALKLVNTVLLLTGQNDRPATLDLCLVDLYSGVAEAMKLGAVASFIMGRDGVEVLESEHVPAGVMNPVEPVMLSKKLRDGDRIVMVSDGVPCRSDDSWFLQTDAGDRLPLSITDNDGWELLTQGGGRPLSVWGEWDGARFQPLSAWEPGTSGSPLWREGARP